MIVACAFCPGRTVHAWDGDTGEDLDLPLEEVNARFEVALACPSFSSRVSDHGLLARFAIEREYDPERYVGLCMSARNQ